MALRPFDAGRDLAQVERWLRCPHVSRWWGPAAAALPELRARDAGNAALICVAGRPVGLVCWQTPTEQELHEAGLDDLPRELIDVDIMIGEPDALGRGIAPRALRLLFETLRAQGASLVGLASCTHNHAALRAWAKAGLLAVRDFVEHGEPYRYFVRPLGAGA